MKTLSAITIGIAVAALAGCDSRSTDPTVAAIAGPGVLSASAALTISPSEVTITVGSTTQLSTNAGAQSSQLQWFSSNSANATVTNTGLVTAFSPGTATLTARFTSDTNKSASASVIVAP
jgi:uncharacterized protein YjdB